MIAAVGDFKFDVYSSRPEVARWIFSSFPTCGKVYDEYFSWHSSNALRHYPLALTISHFVVVHYEGARWRELNKLRPKLVHICETIDRFRVAKDVNEIIAAHPRLDGHLARQAYFMNLDRHNLSQAMSGIDYRGDQLDLQVDPAVTDKFGLGGRRYITIHNGFDAEFHSIYSREPKSTKVYPHFAEAIRLLREQHPDIFIVQLGTKTSVPLPGIDAQLVNKTTLGEMTAVLSGSSLHVDNESGLVHLAASLGTRSCVLFGPTPAEYFGYAGNINIGPRVCGGCWWSTKDWMTTCAKGFERPLCLHEIPPQLLADTVAAAVADLCSDESPVVIAAVERKEEYTAPIS